MSTPMGNDPAAVSFWRRLMRPKVLVPVALLALGVAVVFMALFQPWKAVVDEQVDEAFPGQDPAASSAPADPSAEPDSTITAPTPGEPVLLSAGTFISHEHETTGAAQVFELPDGSQVLRIEDLDTSNGPDLKVWLTDAPVIEGTDGWTVFDDGEWVDLGRLKGNQGAQNYAIPAGTDLSQLTSLSIWCDRFNVSFGAVELEPV